MSKESTLISIEPKEQKLSKSKREANARRIFKAVKDGIQKEKLSPEQVEILRGTKYYFQLRNLGWF